MALRKEGLDEKIMLSAKKDFLEFGYKDASINRIAQNAGVTSGAIYVRYKNKDELFCSLVQPVIDGMEERIDLYKGRYSSLGEQGAWRKINELDKEILDWLIDYIFDYYEEFKLLICQSNGSTVSNFESKFIEFKFQKIYEFIENWLMPVAQASGTELPICKEEIALLLSAQYHNLFEVIRQGYEKKEAKKYLFSLREIYAHGIEKVLSNFLSENVVKQEDVQ